MRPNYGKKHVTLITLPIESVIELVTAALGASLASRFENSKIAGSCHAAYHAQWSRPQTGILNGVHCIMVEPEGNHVVVSSGGYSFYERGGGAELKRAP